MKTVAVMRPERRLAETIALVEGRGYRVLAAPSLDIAHGDPAEYGKALDRLRSGDVDFAVFVSPTSVEEFLKECEDPVAVFEGVTLVSIGSGTTSSLRGAGLAPDIVPKEYTSSGLVDLMAEGVRGKTVLVIHSDKGSPVLIDGLGEAGADIIDLIAYRLSPAGDSEGLGKILGEGSKGNVDAFLFTSPYTSETFLQSSFMALGEAVAREMLESSTVAAIGGPTADRLRSMGVTVDVVPGKATFPDLLDAVADKIGK